MRALFAITLLVVGFSRAIAQDFEMPTATDEHKWLQKLAGEWTSETTCSGPTGEPTKMTGTVSAKMLGDFFVVSDVKNEMPGATMMAVQTVGYDPEQKKYVGTWADSMLGRLWHYTGTVTEEGTKLVLEAEGPNMLEPGKTAMFRDSYKVESADHIIATSEMQMPDGTWQEFARGEMKRKK